MWTGTGWILRVAAWTSRLEGDGDGGWDYGTMQEAEDKNCLKRRSRKEQGRQVGTHVR